MATVTATLGLTLPIGTEKVSRAIINGNMQLIDSYAASTNAAIATIDPKQGRITSIANDTELIALEPGAYEIVLGSATPVTSGYIPSQYGSLDVFYGGNAYKNFIYCGVDNKVYSRICHKTNGTWYTAWQQLAQQKDVVTVKQYSATTVANTAVSPFGAFVQFDVSAADRTAYGNMVSAICHASSTNPAMCMITGGEGGVLVYSKSAATFNVDVVFSKNRI